MLTEEEKRKIEEKVQYEEAYRQKLNSNKPGPVHYENENNTTDKGINNPYAKILSRTEIERNIIPGLIKIYEYLDHCDQLEEIYLNESEKLNIMEYKSKSIDKHPWLTVILGGIGLIYTMLYATTVVKNSLIARFIMFFWELPFGLVNNLSEDSNIIWALFVTITWLVYIFSVPFIISLIIVKIISLVYCKFVRSKILNKKIPLQKEIVNQKNIEFIEYVDRNLYMVKDIPEKYRTTKSIEKFIDYFQSFRVKSFQEAFNMLEEENKKTKNEINIILNG